MVYRTFTLFTLLLISACSPSDSEKTPPPRLFAEQRDALDKAKTVAPAEQKHNEEQQKAVDEQTK